VWTNSNVWIKQAAQQEVEMATNYRAVSESKAWSDRDLRLLRAVADEKRKEKSSGSEEDKKGHKKGK
jgi:hypothetical protein